MILRVLDPKDINFDFDTAAMFQDLESGKEIYIDPASSGAEYRKRFEAHRTEIKSSCDDLGVDLFEISTDQPLESAIFNVIQTRARAGKQVNRAGTKTGRCQVSAIAWLFGLGALMIAFPFLFHLIRRTPKGKNRIQFLDVPAADAAKADKKKSIGEYPALVASVGSNSPIGSRIYASVFFGTVHKSPWLVFQVAMSPF